MRRYLFSLILSASCAAHAATVNFTITLGDIIPTYAGLTAGQAIQGSVSYNANLVSLTGITTLSPQSDSTLTVNLNFTGFSYGALDDTDPDFPQFSFVDGEFRGISYWAANKHPDSFGSIGDGFVQIEANPNRFIYSFDGNEEFSGTFNLPVQSIPEPHTGLLLFCAALLMCHRKRPHHR